MEISNDWKAHLAYIGSKGGQAKTDRKARAARKNGKLGGWPKGRPRKSPISTDENKPLTT